MTDREVMQMALETLDNMAKVDWREWDEFASVEDFVRWAKSRASFTAEALRAALAQPEPDQDGFVFIEARWGKDFFEIQVPDCIGEIVRIYHKQWRGESQTDPEPLWIRNEKGKLELHAPPQRESTCAECDKKQSDGWALYCVDCLREFYKDDPTNKREWIGLTDEEISDTQQQFYKLITFHDKDFARAIEAKLKDKNI